VVSVVYPNSPAALAGMRPGDAVVAINGRPAPKCSADWETIARQDTHTYTVQRGNSRYDATVRPVQLPVLLQRAAGLMQLVSDGREVSWHMPNHMYLSGLVLRSAERHPIVRLVLPASPAAEAGIRSGDRLVSIDGREFGGGKRDKNLLSTAEGSDYRATSHIVVMRGGTNRQVQLRFRSVTEMLRQISGAHDDDRLAASPMYTPYVASITRP
jgi:S1-C subfamily serine protease